jgi:hypothetical protein
LYKVLKQQLGVVNKVSFSMAGKGRVFNNAGFSMERGVVKKSTMATISETGRT